MNITEQEVQAVRDHLQENRIMGRGCACGGIPEMIVERTPWGVPGIIIRCQTCGDTCAAPGDTHIDALIVVVNQWNAQQEHTEPDAAA